MDYIFVIVTAASEQEGEKIGSAIVNEGLAACCNIIPNIKSIFKWKGEISTEKEVMLFIKSKTSLFNKLKDRIKELHSYEVPEIIAFPISQGLPDYFKWMDEVIKA
ncbi:MAG: divalent-cation tolerance protein CutA [Deltaproteobacteria bacterium]|nr:divalent-cation tolerance protein CutA [Deltaproteobacteria bacterium]